MITDQSLFWEGDDLANDLRVEILKEKKTGS
jgi:hypothetical protein